MDSASQQETHELLPIHREALSKSVTGVNVEERKPKLDSLRRWRSGWKFILWLESVACVLVMLFNTGLLLWAVARDRVKDERGILFEGDCDYVGRVNTGLHLLINVFCTILLGASDYGMQCLCAPTRKDVDKVHRRGDWVNIGVPSIRNLGHLSGRRLFLWLCLLLSSVPLHLLYNSTVFYTASAYGYDIYVGYDSPEGKDLALLDADGHQIRGLIMLSDDVETTTRYDWVTGEEVYTPFQWYSPHGWMCGTGSSCAADAARGNWTVGGYRVHSCLSEGLPQRCKLQYSLPLTITVIVANLIKAIVLCYMSLSKGDVPLLTTGDAVASFLHQPDRFSVGRCLLSTKDVTASYFSAKKHLCRPFNYQGNRMRWYSAVQLRDWLSVILFWSLVIGICIGLLIYGQAHDGKEIWDAKFGKTSSMNSSTLIKGDYWPTGLIANTIIANFPQLIFSMTYFLTNSLLTSMTLAAEWSRYAVLRRGLRVSWNPQAAQRQSYFLSLPYRYAIPLMASSATLHWLISQSIFLAGVDAYGPDWALVERLDVMTCGYTPVAIVSALSVGGAMLLSIVALAFRRFDSAMVVAGSCSLAIAAACHPTYDPNLQTEPQQVTIHPPEEQMKYLPVKWGAVAVDGEVGHCTFTSEEVEMPEAGRFYQ
ncbi:hypothetical protein BJX61DRAFT_553168 [Aspergillus egyptiacus]|nr:hypothetical protein BJX61DRAFT_553168 [Aspergillus egyptiacus]